MKAPQIVSRHRTTVEIFAFFAYSRLLILLVGWLSTYVVPKAEWYGNPQSIVDLFFRWDSGWYLSIVQNGYSYVPGQQSSVAFFPLYPLLVKVFSFALVDARITGIMLSNVALLFAIICLFKIIQLDYENIKIPQNSVVFALIFPTSFFLSIFYSESLFLLLSVACFYHARKRRWLVSSMLGYFTALTRTLGVLISIPILIEYLAPTSLRDIKFHRIKKDAFYLLFIPVGLLTYMSYLYIVFQEPLAFLKAQSVWGRGFSPFSALAGIFSYGPFYATIFGGFTVLSFSVLVYLIYSKVRLSYVVYACIQLFFVFSSKLIESLPRYLCVLFPIYLGFALMAKNRFEVRTIKLFSISLLTLFVILFTNGYWFT